MQGPDGARRMVGWSMSGWFSIRSRVRLDEDAIAKPCDGARYQAGLCTLDQLGERLRRQAAQVGMNDVEQWIAHERCGPGVGDFFDVYFPRAVNILDFRHATEHLTPLPSCCDQTRPGKTCCRTGVINSSMKAGSNCLPFWKNSIATRWISHANRTRCALTYYRNHSLACTIRSIETRLANWKRCHRVGVQEGDQSAAEHGRYALGRRRRPFEWRTCVPCSAAMPTNGTPFGHCRVGGPEKSTYEFDAYPATVPARSCNP